MSERTEQIAVMKWWAKDYPTYYECLFSIPNGTQLAGNAGNRARQMNSLKAEGLKPGVSDLFLMVSRGGYHGLFIEMKDAGKTKCSVSIPQTEHLMRAREQGYKAEWCAGKDSAIKLITEYMES